MNTRSPSKKSSLNKSQKVFSGVKFDIHTLTIKGRHGQAIRKDVVVHPGAVVILPLIDDENLIMIRNERFAVGKELWELPAGTLEPNELPIETAKRELSEETGYKTKDIKQLLTFFPSPGFCNEIMYSYVARGLTYVGQQLDESEHIKVEIIKWKKALKMIQQGVIMDAKTLTTLLFYYAFK